MKRYYLLILVIIYMVLGCTKMDSSKKVGYLITPSKNDIYYKCGNKEADLKESGEFICSSFPVAFYLGNKKMGSVSYIHQDGYVFPQDMDSITIASR